MYLSERDRHIVPPSCSLSDYILVNDSIDLIEQNIQCHGDTGDRTGVLLAFIVA